MPFSNDDQYLKAIELFEQHEYSSARLVFEECYSKTQTDDHYSDEHSLNCLFNVATCLANEGKFEQALETLSKLSRVDSTDPNDLLYNKALCYYRLQNYDEALQLVDQLITICRQTYPEFPRNSNNNQNNQLLEREDYDYSDDNSDDEKLQTSCLIESLNLRSAILFKKNPRNLPNSKHCLDEIPYKRLDQLDSVTLHNLALYEHNVNLNSSIDKLNYLCKLDNNEAIGEEDRTKFASSPISVPRESFLNLILLNTFYSGGWQLEILLEFMRENRKQIEKYISLDVIQFIEILLERSQTSSEDLIYRKLDKLLERVLKGIERDQQRLKQHGEEEAAQDDDQKSINNKSNSKRNQFKGSIISKNIEIAMIILTHQCQILWDNNQYEALERLLLKVEPVLKEEKLWKRSLADTLYMLDTRFDDCANLYEELINEIDNEQDSNSSLLNVDPYVLGNLCVSYVLTGRNGDAEALIKDVENDEAQFFGGSLNLNSNSGNDIQATATKHQPQGQPISHLTIINLIIGTLYCVKHNYEFGLTRIFKSLEPIEQKLKSTTWTEVKRCILTLLDCHCKQMIYIKDDLFDQIITFLVSCERHGVLIETMDQIDSYSIINNSLVSLSKQELDFFHGTNSVTYEARYLRSIALAIIHD